MAVHSNDSILLENQEFQLKEIHTENAELGEFNVLYENKHATNTFEIDKTMTPTVCTLDLPKIIIYFPYINCAQFPANTYTILGLTLDSLLRYQNALIFTEGVLAHEIVQESLHEINTLLHKRKAKSIQKKRQDNIKSIHDKQINITCESEDGSSPIIGVEYSSENVEQRLQAELHNVIIVSINLRKADDNFTFEEDCINIECSAVVKSDENETGVKSDWNEAGRDSTLNSQFFYNREGPTLYELILELADDTAFNALSVQDNNYALCLYDLNYAIHTGDINRVMRRITKIETVDNIKEQIKKEICSLYTSFLHLFAFGTVEMLREFLQSRVFQIYFDLRELSFLLGCENKESLTIPDNINKVKWFTSLIDRILYDLYKMSVEENLLATWTRRTVKDIINRLSDETNNEVSDQLLRVISKTKLVWKSPKRKPNIPFSVSYFAEYLLIWASVSKRYGVAELMLEFSGLQMSQVKGIEKNDQTKRIASQIGNALAIYFILKHISRRTSVSDNESSKLEESALNFVSIAIKLLETAIQDGKYFLEPILNTSIILWNKRPVIELAYECQAREFFTHDIVQLYLTKVWNGDLESFKKIEDLSNQAESFQSLLLSAKFKKDNGIKKRKTFGNLAEEKEVFDKHEKLRLNFAWFLRRLISPRSTFILHGFAYFIFVISYTVNLVFFWRPTYLTAYDYIYTVWSSAYILDEVHQIITIFKWKVDLEHSRNSFSSALSRAYSEGQLKVTLWTSFKDYADDIWNTFDILIVVWFIISITLRFISVINYSHVGVFAVIVRILYSVQAMFYSIRIFQYVLLKRSWGLLLYTLYYAFLRMIKFLVILLVMTYCFSIAQYVLFDPSKVDPASVAQLILFPPYFQIFGEYGLDAVNNLVYNFTSEPPDSAIYFWESLTWVAYALIAVWIMVSNVLLLNLMISYFTKVYDEVLENAMIIYKTLFFTLVLEYQERSYWPPPFNLITYTNIYIVVPLFNCLIYCCSCKCFASINKTEYPSSDSESKRIKNVSTYLPLFSFYNAHDIVEKYWAERKNNV